MNLQIGKYLYQLTNKNLNGFCVIAMQKRESKGMSPNGCYMRLGTSTQPMSTALIDEYYAKRIHTTLRNIPSPRQDLTFAQLKIYYQERGLELKMKSMDIAH